MEIDGATTTVTSSFSRTGHSQRSIDHILHELIQRILGRAHKCSHVGSRQSDAIQTLPFI